MHIAEFIRKFAVFLPTNLKTNDSNNTIKDHRQCVSEIMGKADLDESLYKIGINQVNFILCTYLSFNYSKYVTFKYNIMCVLLNLKMYIVHDHKTILSVFILF